MVAVRGVVVVVPVAARMPVLLSAGAYRQYRGKIAVFEFFKRYDRP